MLSMTNEFLEHAFDILNEVYYGGELPRVMITIQSSPRAYGYITIDEIWKTSEGQLHEINIGAENLNRPIEQILATLNHEMVHLYCMEKGISDTSKGGRYHNKRFKNEAEKRELKIEYHPYIGYSLTSPTEQFIRVLENNGLLDKGIEHYRATVQPITMTGGGEDINVGKKKTSTRKYICPSCGTSIRATKDVFVICGDCMETMTKE